MGVSITIDAASIKGILDDFDRFGDEIQHKTLAVAGKRAAEVMKKEAIRVAPKSNVDRSKFGQAAVRKDGTIGIKYEYKRKHLRQQINIQKVTDRAGNPKYLVRVGDAYWANFLEGGTVQRNKRGRIDRAKTAFMGKTADRMTPEVVNIFEQELDKALSKYR